MSPYPYTGPKLKKYGYSYGRAEHQPGVLVEPEVALWRQAHEEETGVRGHGLSGYRWRRCRCPTCRAAKAVDAKAYRARLKAEGRRSSNR